MAKKVKNPQALVSVELYSELRFVISLIFLSAQVSHTGNSSAVTCPSPQPPVSLAGTGSQQLEWGTELRPLMSRVSVSMTTRNTCSFTFTDHLVVFYVKNMDPDYICSYLKLRNSGTSKMDFCERPSGGCG